MTVITGDAGGGELYGSSFSGSHGTWKNILSFLNLRGSTSGTARHQRDKQKQSVTKWAAAGTSSKVDGGSALMRSGMSHNSFVLSGTYDEARRELVSTQRNATALVDNNSTKGAEVGWMRDTGSGAGDHPGSFAALRGSGHHHQSERVEEVKSNSSFSMVYPHNSGHHHHGPHPAPSSVPARERLVSYGKVFHSTRRRNPRSTFYDAFFLDSGQITCGERRRKHLMLPGGYRTTIIGFVEKKVLKKDLNAHFYIQHPSLEVREIKLTQLRKIRHELLQYVMEEGSPLEISTAAHAYWYFERLAEQGMVGKTNRKVILAACVMLAIKFLETGDVMKKLEYFKQRWLCFHKTGGGSRGNAVATVGGVSTGLGSPTAEEKEEEKDATVDWEEVWRVEFRVYVGLDFTLLPERGSPVVKYHVERLLQQINVTSQEYFSKSFKPPEHFQNSYYSIYY